MRFSILPLVLAFAVTACGGSDTAPSTTPTVKFSTTDLIVGTGTVAEMGKVVTVDYTGWVYSSTAAENKGTQFDTSVGKTPFSFRCGAAQVIKGWDQGVPGMKVGGKRRLVIPPDLAYGSTATGSIPANSTLVFEVTLLSVQ